MPAYLFLMYVALRLISSPGFKSIFNQSATGVPAIGEGVFGPTFIGVIIQFIIAFLFINAPLVVALSIGGWGGKWAPDAVSIWKGIGSWAGRNTAGRAGRRIGESFDQMTAQETFMGSKTLYKIGAPLTRNLNISQSTREALEKMEKGKYGGSKNLESIKKENKERAKVITAVQRGRKQDDAISTLMKSSSISTTKPAWETVTKMTAKELGEVDFEKLKNPVVASHLSSQQVDKLLDGDTLTEDQKNELRSIRKKALNAGLPQTDPQVRKDFIKGLSGKELAKLDEAVLTNTVVMDHLLPSQLKEMGDISGAAKATIGNYIRSRPHPAAGFMRSNQAEWS